MFSVKASAAVRLMLHFVTGTIILKFRVPVLQVIIPDLAPDIGLEGSGFSFLMLLAKIVLLKITYSQDASIYCSTSKEYH